MKPLPPGQQLVAPGKWPTVGERLPDDRDEPWRVHIAGAVACPRTWTLDQLATMDVDDFVVDIHCVTRWSKPGVRFRGVLLASLLRHVDPLPAARFVTFGSRSARGHSTSLPLSDAVELGTIVALECEGAPLGVERGGPVRTVVPGRYFYKSLKWLESIELLEDDRLGYWESEAGYHNVADPWSEQRYIAPGLSKRETAELLASRAFRGRDLRSLQAGGMDLEGLDATGALLRDADFRASKLKNARFDRANLSNAHFAGADLRGASFAGADVEGADFTGADLRSADLRVLSLLGVSFHAAGTLPPAVIDASTQFDPRRLDDLTPGQRAALPSIAGSSSR